MREEVTIILNEREPAKSKMAGELLAALLAKNITASRIPPSSKTLELIKARKPRIIVTDYLLEDLGTGFDILEMCKALADAPSVIFLTDEPSVAVAVSALKAGAQHYLEIQNPGALDVIVDEVARTKAPTGVAPAAVMGFENLLSPSAARRAVHENLQLMTAGSTPPYILLGGPYGSGKRTIARALVKSLKIPWQEWDVRTSLHDISTLIEPALRGLGAVLISGIEEDPEGIAAVMHLLPRAKLPVILSTTAPELHSTFHKVDKRLVVKLPSLRDMSVEISAFAEFFGQQASTLLPHTRSARKVPTLSASHIAALQRLTWTGELTQLRDVVHHVLLQAELPLSDDAIVEAHTLWATTHEGCTLELPPKLTVARALHSCNHNERIACAMLGISRVQLRQIVEERAP